jgi:SNF2 family DNA or RNA helicase
MGCNSPWRADFIRAATSFIKDATTIVSRAACYLEAERRIALTGTPIQNKLDDVWALIKFLRFAPFDDKSVWTQYILGLAKAGNSLGVARLQTILKHCTLRRTKESTNANGEKILNLPPRREEIREIEFSPKEREVYDKYFARSKEEFIQMQKDSGKGSFVNVLHQILQLRQICDHWMLPNDASDEMLEDDIIAEAEESMDAEEVRAAIAQDGNFTFRRALAFTSSLKENGALVCGSCNSDLEVPEMAKPEEDVEEEPAGKKTKGKKKAKGGNYPLVTKCLHVFCVYAG